MVDRLLKHIKFHYLNEKIAFLVFWGIVLSIVLINHSGILNRIFEIEIYIGNYGDVFLAVLIYLLFAGIEGAYSSLPHLMAFGATRGDYFRGRLVFFILLSLIMSLLVLLTIGLEYLMTGGVAIFLEESVDSLSYMTLFFFQTAACIMTGAIFSLIGSLFYSKGKTYTFTFFLVIILVAVGAGLRAENVFSFIINSLLFFHNLTVNWSSILLMGIVSAVIFGLEYLVIKSTEPR